MSVESAVATLRAVASRHPEVGEDARIETCTKLLVDEIAQLRAENEALRAMLTALDDRGGLGLDVHASIRKALGKPPLY